MNRIKLSKIFENLNHTEYVIIKYPENLDKYDRGSDLDILCRNLNEATELIIKGVTKQISETEKIKVTNIHGHRHIDVTRNNKIEIRFDLCSKLPLYNEVKLKESYFEAIIERRIFYTPNNSDHSFYVPSLIDESIMRYIEYNEYFSKRPDKIKHIDYILNNLSDKNKKEMLNRLHYFLAFQPPVVENKRLRLISRIKENFLLIKKVFSYFKLYGFNDTVRKVIKKLK